MTSDEKNHSNSKAISGSIGIFLLIIIGGLLFILFKVYEVGNELQSIVKEDIKLTKNLTRITEYQLEQAIRFERADRFGSPLNRTERIQTSFNQAVSSFTQFSNLLKFEIKESKKLLDKLYHHSVNERDKLKFQQLKKHLIEVENGHEEYENHANIVFSMLLKNQDNQATLSFIERVELEEDELDLDFERLLDEIENFTLEATQRAAKHELLIMYLLFALAISVLIVGMLLMRKITEIFVAIETAKKEIEILHAQTKDSIEYASIIQRALLPNEDILSKHFEDYFILWQPRDVIGGDIYLVEELNQDEVIIMVIDCTGHGVPGAFVTMLVKAIQHQATAAIQHSSSINPANILTQFNQRIKQLLQQEKMDSESNVGFDGVVLHVNKSNHSITFAGANNPLYIMQNDHLRIIKGDKHSIGYKNSKAAFEFTNHRIDISIATKIYLSTDGFIDQTGGEKGFPYGRKKFIELIQNLSDKSFSNQRSHFIEELLAYENVAYKNVAYKNERKDDVTIIGFLV
jgi:serine phosphatase RsbU (regulator of sigma subunit)